MVQLWCSKPLKTQVFNLVSLLFCVFKDIAVADKKHFRHVKIFPYIVSF